MPSFRKLISKSVDKVFTVAGDLTEKAVFENSRSESYQFPQLDKDGSLLEGGEVISDTVMLTIDVIVADYTNKDGLPQRDVLAKENDLKNPTVYDLITLRDRKHNIVNYTVSPGIVTLRVNEI